MIALAFLMLFSLLLVATLSSADGGLRFSNAVKGQPKDLFGADGAIEQTIQQMRYDRNQGIDGAATFCPLGSASVSPSQRNVTTTVNGQTYQVKCEAQSGSGQATVEGTGPTLGIIALATYSSGEVGYRQTGNSVVRLDGGLYSNSTVSFQNGTVCDTATANNCQQLNLCPKNAKTITDGVLTNNSNIVTSATASFVSPGSATSTDVGAPITGQGIPGGTTIASVQSASQATMSKQATVTGNGRTITFREDYPLLQKHCHPDSSAKGEFSSLSSPLAPQACPTTSVVAVSFNCNPGNVFLSGSDPYYSAAQITGFTNQTAPACGTQRIVTLQPGRYSDVTGLNALTTDCDKLIHFTPGVYFFDFPSTNAVWTIGASNLKNMVVVGGVPMWDQTRGVVLGSMKNGAREVTTKSATFTATDVGKFIQSGYNIPYGTRITTYTDSTHVTVSNAATNGFNDGPVTISTSESLCNKAPNGADHAGVQFIFGGASRIDAVDGKTELCSALSGSNPQIVIYGARAPQCQILCPALSPSPAQSGCATATPYLSASATTCPTLRTSGPKVVFIANGSFYAATGVIDMSLQTVGYQVVSRGIIARVVALGISPSADYKDPLIYSPDFATVLGADRQVLLTACTGGTCDGGGVPRLRAMIRFKDTRPGTAQVDVGNAVVTESWSVLR